MGKTAVFVLATLQQLEAVDGQVSVLVMCHTRELAFQISKEYERFSKYMSGVKVSPSFLLVLNSWNLKCYVLLKLTFKLTLPIIRNFSSLRLCLHWQKF